MFIKLLSIFTIIALLNTSCGNEDKSIKENTTDDTTSKQNTEPQTKPKPDRTTNNKLQFKINGRPVYTPKNSNTPMEALIRDEVLYESSLVEKRDQDPKFVNQIERYKRNLLIGQLKRDIIQKFNSTYKITDEELDKYYNENINQYTYLDLIDIRCPSEQIANDIYKELSGNTNITIEEITDRYKRENIDIVVVDLSNTRAFNNKFDKLEIGQFTKPEKVVTKYSIYRIEKAFINSIGKVKPIILSNYKSILKKKALDDYVSDSIKNNNIKIEEANK